MIRFLEFGGADAQKFASALSNKTAKRILTYLETHTATATQIGKALKLSPSTVHYNLELLRSCGLVVVEGYNYSEKGKEVLHYTLTKDHIVIAPRADEHMATKLRSLIPLVLIGFLLLILSFIPFSLQLNTEHIATISTRDSIMQSDSSPAMYTENADAVAMPQVAETQNRFVREWLFFVSLGVFASIVVLLLLVLIRTQLKKRL